MDTRSPMNETWNYASIIGMLMYLSSNSRPDIQFAVHQCARFTHNPKKSHVNAVKRIVRYLIATRDQGMVFECTSKMKLDCYADADYAGMWGYESDQDPVCVKSRTGYIMTLGDCPLVWASKLQNEISLSTLESEYIALSMSMCELVPLRRLMKEIAAKVDASFNMPTLLHSTVFEDNNGAIGLATSPKLTPRTKHIAVKYHWFRSHLGVQNGIILTRIDSENQKADMFTKGLNEVTFKRIRKKVVGW